MASQNWDRDFPQELLTANNEDRKAFFASKVVAHPHLKSASDRLWQLLHNPGGATIILVYGPPGVGKSTLLKRTHEKLWEEAIANNNIDTGSIPYGSVEAVAPKKGVFNWSQHNRRILEQFDEPLIDLKRDFKIARNAAGQLALSRNANPNYLDNAVETTLKERKVRALLTDEAQHLNKVGSGRNVLNQMDAIKSLASVTGTLQVLFGTYELLQLAGLSGQLDRRSIHIHFPRYQASKMDLKFFQVTVNTFQRALPVKIEPNLVEHNLRLYEGTLGCVGTLKEWLYQALVASLDAGEESVSWKRIEEFATAPSRLVYRISEIIAGENQLKEDKEQHLILQAKLGLKQKDTSNNNSNSSVSTSSKNSKSHPGERAAHRDKVKGDDDE